MSQIDQVYKAKKTEDPNVSGVFNFVGCIPFPNHYDVTNKSPLLDMDINTINKQEWRNHPVFVPENGYDEILVTTDQLDKLKESKDPMLPDLNELEAPYKNTPYTEKEENSFMVKPKKEQKNIRVSYTTSLKDIAAILPYGNGQDTFFWGEQQKEPKEQEEQEEEKQFILVPKKEQKEEKQFILVPKNEQKQEQIKLSVNDQVKFLTSFDDQNFKSGPICNEQINVVQNGTNTTKAKTEEKQQLQKCNFAPQKPIEIIEHLRPWQAEIRDMCLLEPEIKNTQIYWFWESKGNVGKSAFVKYMLVKHNALVTQSGYKTDILKFVFQTDIEYHTMVFFDIPRTQKGKISYSALENIKSGLVSNTSETKYKTNIKVFNSPHVIVFANFPPEKPEFLSKDKWVIREII